MRTLPLYLLDHHLASLFHQLQYFKKNLFLLKHFLHTKSTTLVNNFLIPEHLLCTQLLRLMHKTEFFFSLLFHMESMKTIETLKFHCYSSFSSTKILIFFNTHFQTFFCLSSFPLCISFFYPVISKQHQIISLQKFFYFSFVNLQISSFVNFIHHHCKQKRAKTLLDSYFYFKFF